MTRFRLLHLTFAGPGKESVSVDFDPRLTVIYGASDTGKSFIVEAIEYLLGAGPITMVPEADGYTQILLGLELHNGETITVARTPDSSVVGIHSGDVRDLILTDPQVLLRDINGGRSRRTLSRFLLDQLGLEGSTVRTNDAGRTRLLQLRDLAHLAVATETRMVSPIPPPLRTRTSGVTASRSVIKLLLTGEDEPTRAEGLNAGQRRVHKGKIALLDQLYVGLSHQLSADVTRAELHQRLTRVNEALHRETARLDEISLRHAEATALRAGSAVEAATLQQRIAEVRDLQSRFRLLRRQYTSDLDRLEMVREAGTLLGYFHRGTCVFCGAAPEHQSPSHETHGTTQLHVAVLAEAEKTTALLQDLDVTLSDVDNQLRDLTTQSDELARQLRNHEALIVKLAESLVPVRRQTEALLAARSGIERDLATLGRMQELDELRSELVSDGAVAGGTPSGAVPSRIVAAFERAIQHALQAWRVPGTEDVVYDQYQGELVVGRRMRTGRGKGMRSVLYAAFTVGLAQFCLENRLPHPGFVVLDSPVVTYREPGSGDVQLTANVVQSFYHHVLHDFAGQAIVIENGDPPGEIVEAAHTHMFTGTADGRSGLFPT